ncbi:MAG: isoprenyl transferase [Anaerolineae bacterium]
MPPESETANQYPPLQRVPRHVGVIMDGNGRWARRRGLPRIAGHRAGTENLRRVLRAAVEFGIQYLTIYAFSTENWGRPESEVQGLLSILERVIDREVPKLHEQGVRLCHLGRMERIPAKLEKRVREAIELTKDNDRLVLNVAFNYGGRAEIVDAVRQIIADAIPAGDVDADLIDEYLYTAGQPDPDLIIRTSGEMRLSNFLVWQAAYAEFYTTPTLWPDFDKEELYEALQDFDQRERRFGLVPGKAATE